MKVIIMSPAQYQLSQAIKKAVDTHLGITPKINEKYLQQLPKL